jgi:type I restriction enzyme S subunit
LPYEKVGKNEPVCIADEVPFDIPESWEWVRLESICTKLVDGDHNPPKGCSYETTYVMVSSTNINDDCIVELEKVRYLEKNIFDKENERTNAATGDIFFTSVGSLGRSCVYEGGLNICFQRSVSVIHTLIFNYYLKYCLDSAYIQQKIVREATGTAQKGFYLNQLALLLIPIPPIEEQHRIVSKYLETVQMQKEYYKTNETLDVLNSGFPATLKKSILQYAVQGKLVPQDPADEPASVLLKRIRTEKEQLVKEGKIKRDKHESVIFRRDNSYYEKVDGIERCIDDELPFEIPESWGWCRLKSLTENITSGSRDWAKYYSTTGAAFLRMGNLSKNSFDLRLEHIQRVSIPSKAEGTRTSLQSGDLLFSITGDVGMLGLIPDGFEEAYINQHTAMIRFLPEIRNKYIPYLLLTDYAQKFYNANQHGIKNSFRLDSIGELLVSIPPEKELFRILQRISLVLSKIVVL